VFNCIKSKNPNKNVCWILNETAEVTGTLIASFYIEGRASVQ
jgi:hypothetical protein